MTGRNLLKLSLQPARLCASASLEGSKEPVPLASRRLAFRRHGTSSCGQFPRWRRRCRGRRRSIDRRGIYRLTHALSERPRLPFRVEFAWRVRSFLVSQLPESANLYGRFGQHRSRFLYRISQSGFLPRTAGREISGCVSTHRRWIPAARRGACGSAPPAKGLVSAVRRPLSFL